MESSVLLLRLGKNKIVFKPVFSCYTQSMTFEGITLVPPDALKLTIATEALLNASLGENFHIKTIDGYDGSLPKARGKSLLEIVRSKSLIKHPLRIVDMGSGSDLKVPLSLERDKKLSTKAEVEWWPINPSFKKDDNRNSSRIHIHPVIGIIGSESTRPLISEDGEELPFGQTDIVICNNAIYQFPSRMLGVQRCIELADPHNSAILISGLNIKSSITISELSKKMPLSQWFERMQKYIQDNKFTTSITYNRLLGSFVIEQYGSNPLLYLPLRFSEDFQVGINEHYDMVS